MRLYSYKDLRPAGVPYTRSHIDRLERAGLFPRRLKLNPQAPIAGTVAWVVDEIDAWIEARAAAR